MYYFECSTGYNFFTGADLSGSALLNIDLFFVCLQYIHLCVNIVLMECIFVMSKVVTIYEIKETFVAEESKKHL